MGESIGKKLESFTRLCLKYENEPVAKIYMRFVNQYKNDQEAAEIGKYFSLFIEVGEAARNEKSIYKKKDR